MPSLQMYPAGGAGASNLQSHFFQGALSMEWSAKPYQLDEPFGSWADDLAAAFVRLEPRKIAEHPFEGTITRIDDGSHPDFPRQGYQAQRSAIAFPYNAEHGRSVFRQPATGRGGLLYAMRSRADLRARRSCGCGYDRTVRNRKLSRLQAVLFCRAATSAPAGFLRAAPVIPFSDGSRPGPLPDTRRVRRTLPQRAAGFGNFRLQRRKHRRPDLSCTSGSCRGTIRADQRARVVVDDAGLHRPAQQRSRSRRRPARGKVRLLATLRAQAVFRHGSNGRRTHQRQTDRCLHPQFTRFR